ncbi:glycosyltransferase family 2 protein [Polluticoccus soli]|uniref:glycosyltransferase family 2 protein n=1 Tax=Polluticoccus soli TaxID=3034150 RepID=UPI0023E1E3EC|nr:glycosyltransferase family A protein [Flavipsychrobacter sp. JY13-12]
MIALLYFSDTSVEWSLGASIQLQRTVGSVEAGLQELLIKGAHEWVLLWDYEFGAPDIDALKQLIQRPVDVWHAGVKLGLRTLPDVLNYVHPTWMYTKNAAPDVEHTSFRFSTKAGLIKLDALRRVGPVSSQYLSLEMYGVALGYKMLKSGAIIRYSPRLVSVDFPDANVPFQDEWLFARQFFPPKWQRWTLLNKPGLAKNLSQWLRTHSAESLNVLPVIHSSLNKLDTVRYETVSVLAPTLNRYSYLLNELEQLSKQTVLPVEVLITDQTNEAERVELDFSKYPNLDIRYFPQNERGQCIAWNKLLQEAKGEYVLFLGDDADDIKPDFIEKLLSTRQRFDCDMVASNVVEIGTPEKPIHPYHFVSDTFPITLIRKSVVVKAGFMDMFFNKNIRADHDLAMRCHLDGALMVFDSSAVILHHRAPSGGLRTHNARVITNHIAKNSITKIAVPTSSEIYLAKKYYSTLQYKSYIRIKYLNQLLINGSVFRRLLRGLVFVYKLPALVRSYKENYSSAEQALAELPNR